MTVQCPLLSVNRVQQLLQGLQASGDEGQQLTAVIEMCQVSPGWSHFYLSKGYLVGAFVRTHRIGSTSHMI